jgi:hypothetical protein
MYTVEAFDEVLKLEVVSGQISGIGQTVEIIDVQGGCAIRTLESLVGLAPRVTSVAFTAVLEMIHLTHARTEPGAGPRV